MAAQNLWYYRDQIFRIVEESLEVALVICNSELNEFTLAKIFDIFNQILPTGFVLSTGYWPFYNTLKKQSICVCARYGIDCRHCKHDHHWLDLEGLSMDNSTMFSSKYGQLDILNSETEVTPVTGGTAGYTLNIKLTFQYKKIEKGRPRRKKDESLNPNQDEVVHVIIYSRFNIQREYYPAFHTLVFQPSPFFYETYGTHFPQLLQARSSALSNHMSAEINQKYYTVSVENMPQFSLILHHVNLPVYIHSKNTQALYAHLDPPRLKKMTHNKFCQTEEQENTTDVWKYKELIGNLKPLWSDSRASSCETLLNHPQAVNVDYVFETYVMNGNQIPGQCCITEINSERNALSESILNGVEKFSVLEEDLEIKKEAEEIPTSTVQDAEYDVQWPKWGFQRSVAKRRGRKKKQNENIYKDVLMGTHNKYPPSYLNSSQNKLQKQVPESIPTNYSGTTENGTSDLLFHNASGQSYASVLKAPKEEKSCYEYTAETRSRVFEKYRDDPDFQWFESQFPDTQPSSSLTEAEINERFEIAEEFIREDLEREGNKNNFEHN